MIILEYALALLMLVFLIWALVSVVRFLGGLLNFIIDVIKFFIRY